MGSENNGLVGTTIGTSYSANFGFAGSYLLQTFPSTSIEWYNFAGSTGRQGFSQPLIAALDASGFSRISPGSVLNFAGTTSQSGIGGVGATEVVSILENRGFQAGSQVGFRGGIPLAEESGILVGSRIADIVGTKPGFFGGEMVVAESKVGSAGMPIPLVTAQLPAT